MPWWCHSVARHLIFSTWLLSCAGWTWCLEITNLNWRLLRHENKAAVSLPSEDWSVFISWLSSKGEIKVWFWSEFNFGSVMFSSAPLNFCSFWQPFVEAKAASCTYLLKQQKKRLPKENLFSKSKEKNFKFYSSDRVCLSVYIDYDRMFQINNLSMPRWHNQETVKPTESQVK